jgi:hypothetical protein
MGLRDGANGYAYANNNPLLYRDEYGLKIKLVFEILRNATRTLIDDAARMRNIMRGLRYRDPGGAPLQIWTNGDEVAAKGLGRMAGQIECVDEGLPFVRVKNNRGQEIAQIIFDCNSALGLAATLAPLSGLSILSDAVQGNSGPLLDTMDMLLGMLMPGMMTVDPSVITPGAGGIPQASGVQLQATGS